MKKMVALNYVVGCFFLLCVGKNYGLQLPEQAFLDRDEAAIFLSSADGLPLHKAIHHELFIRLNKFLGNEETLPEVPDLGKVPEGYSDQIEQFMQPEILQALRRGNEKEASLADRVVLALYVRGIEDYLLLLDRKKNNDPKLVSDKDFQQQLLEIILPVFSLTISSLSRKLFKERLAILVNRGSLFTVIFQYFTRDVLLKVSQKQSSIYGPRLREYIQELVLQGDRLANPLQTLETLLKSTTVKAILKRIKLNPQDKRCDFVAGRFGVNINFSNLERAFYEALKVERLVRAEIIYYFALCHTVASQKKETLARMEQALKVGHSKKQGGDKWLKKLAQALSQIL